LFLYTIGNLLQSLTVSSVVLPTLPTPIWMPSAYKGPPGARNLNRPWMWTAGTLNMLLCLTTSCTSLRLVGR